VNDPAEILKHIARSRERVNHWKQWKNEPSCAKKLRSWRRQLKLALIAARELNLTVPPDPFAPPPPPPPPPTEEELRAQAIAELKLRRRVDWQVQKGFTGWAPWGESGWSAVVVTTANYRWCQVNRVNARTEEVVAKGKVKRDRMLARDPEQKGKDKPGVPPTEVFEAESPADTPADRLEPAAAGGGWLQPVVEQKVVSADERAERQARVAETLAQHFPDSPTGDDW